MFRWDVSHETTIFVVKIPWSHHEVRFFGMKSHGFLRNHLWSQADSRISFLSFWDRFLARAVRKKPGKSAGNGDFMVAKNPGHDEIYEFSWWFHKLKSWLYGGTKTNCD